MGNENQIKNSSITRQEDDFAQWYTDVCKKAELMDYSSVKGFIILAFILFTSSQT